MFREIMENLVAEMVSIPARSPDINCIETFFNLLEKVLIENTKNKNITKEEFSAIVQNIIVNFDRKSINSLTGSINKQIKVFIKAMGQKTKY